MEGEFDVAVVGAGINGLCTAYHLSRQSSLKVLLLEQFDLMHCQGSSHSKIRITRAAYPDPIYVKMAEESRNVEWPELEKKLGEKLVRDNKFVAFGNDDIYLTYRGLAERMKLPTLTIVSGSKQLCPALKLQQFKDIVVDTNAGIILAERTIQLLVEYLKNQSNVTIREKTTVKAIVPGADDVLIKTNKQDYKVGRVVLALEIKDLVQVNRQVVLYLKLKTDKANTDIGKYFSWMSSHKGEEYYSLPGIGTDWVKVAQHDNVIGDQKLSTEKQVEKVLDYVKSVFNYEIEGVQKTQECWYTSTKDEQFIIDFLDEKKRVLGSSTCSGHSFKFGPLIGRILSDLIQTGTTSVETFRDNRLKFSINYHKGVNLLP